MRYAFLALPLLLGACSLDPWQRPGTWQATGAVDRNLAVMVANPTDLMWGRGTPGSDGVLAAAAVRRLREDKVHKLPDDSLSASGGGSSGGAGGGEGQ